MKRGVVTKQPWVWDSKQHGNILAQAYALKVVVQKRSLKVHMGKPFEEPFWVTGRTLCEKVLQRVLPCRQSNNPVRFWIEHRVFLPPAAPSG